MLSVVIILAIGGAYAATQSQWITVTLPDGKTKKCDCTELQQYFRWGNNTYLEVGPFYNCIGTVGVCTYYKPNPVQYPNFYQLCQQGAYSEW